MAATASVPTTDAAKQVLMRADAAMAFLNQCGLSRSAQVKCQYTPDGRLWETNKYGVYEVNMLPAQDIPNDCYCLYLSGLLVDALHCPCLHFPFICFTCVFTCMCYSLRPRWANAVDFKLPLIVSVLAAD